MIAGIPLFLSLVVVLQPTPLEQAYQSLRERRYEDAVRSFRAALESDPSSIAVHKDLAYTLLKIGENEEARRQFEQAMQLDPRDPVPALEYAFLCNELKHPAEARRVFDRIRKGFRGVPQETAEQAYENIDRPLREGIARWQKALMLAPNNDSAHEELARLAEARDELALAAEHFEAAMKLRPDRPSLALDLGRVLLAQGDTEKAQRVLERAAAGAEPRTAEVAREMAPSAVGRAPTVEVAVARAPTPTAKQMGMASYQRSYLFDAQRYLEQAHAEDPGDDEVMLKLGEVLNLLGQDEAAMGWFSRARKSANPDIRRQAARSWSSLHSQYGRIRTTAWAYPVYSSRWSALFLYGQAKTEFKLGKLPFRPYLSARIMGDVGLSKGGDPVIPGGMFGPIPLSERAVIAGAGIAAPLGRNLHAWAEAGEAIRYSGESGGRLTPDYRGGLFFNRGWGAHMTSPEGGWFAELDVDGVYLSRYEHDVLAVVQNRTGYTSPPIARLGGFQWQVLLHTNFNADVKGQYWANFVEIGPGYRFRWEWMPRSLYFGAMTLTGNYTVMQGNPREPRYRDFRVGMWYAITR